MLSLSASGQAYNIAIKSWSMADGLSDRQVNYICRDARGFIWLCTRTGLNRFDGYSFKIYNTEKKNIPFDNLSGMVQDNTGAFWIMGTDPFQNPDNLFADNNLFIFDPLTESAVSFKDKTGYKGAIRFNLLQKVNDTMLFFGSTHDPYFFTWSAGSGLHKIRYPVPVSRLLAWSSNSTFWVLDASNLVCEINAEGRLLKRCRHRENTLALPDLTVGSYTATKAMPGQKATYKPLTEVEIHRQTASLCMYDANGQRLPSANPADYNLGGITLKELIARLDPLHYTYCTHIFVLSNNEVWMSSSFGLVRITVTKNKFRKYFHLQGHDISNNSFRTLLVRDNILYAVNEAQGIQELNLASGAERMFSPPFSDGNMRLFSLAPTSDGRLFGLREREVYMRGKQWSAFTGDQLKKDKELIPTPPIVTWKITEIARDSFLIAGWRGLRYYNLSKRKFTNFDKYNAYTSLANSLIVDVLDEGKGRKWLCSNSGLYVYDTAKGITERYSSADTGMHFIPSSDIHHVYRDADGIYWLGTANGLIRWDRAHHQYRLFSIADGLSNNNICAIYEDNRQRLWLTSDYGLMQFDKNSLRVKTYLTNDGISYNEFNRLSHTRDSAGNLYFGTLNGVTAFHPDDFPADDGGKNAPLAVTSFEQFDSRSGKLLNKTAALIRTSTIILKPGDRFFNLGLTLLSFNDAIYTTYYWKIDEIDTAWASFKDPTLRLSGLPYGRMTLHIKAQDSDGSWGANELLFHIQVIRPFYLRTWFIVLALTLIAATVFTGFRWRTYRLQKENIRLDSIVQQKTTELEQTITQLERSSRQKDILMREIHHRVKNNLQVISTLLNLQLTKIADEKARQSLEESASRISSIALVHFQLYHKEELTSIELSNFINELLRQITAVYLKTGQIVNLHNEVEQTWLDIDTALPLGLILNELMTNSFKYAYQHNAAPRMEISLEQTGGSFTLRYCDYGPGLPEGYEPATSKSLGITLIKSLARQLGGSFSYNRNNNCFLVKFLDTHTRKNIA